MHPRISSVRRVFAGKEVGVLFGVLLAGSLLITGGFVPGYLAVLAASGVRNVYLGWLGSGPLFYAVAGVFLYLQAVVLTAVCLGLGYVYTSIQNRSTRSASS